MSDLPRLIQEFKTAYAPDPEAYTLRGVTTQNDAIRLRPLQATADQISIGDVNRLTKWRNRHRQAFLSEFRATPERTLRWLTEVYGPDPTRILFMIEMADGTVFGHAGLCEIDGQRSSAEVDNIVRGEDMVPGGMGAAVAALCEWMRSLGVRHISVRVLADNPAVSFYQELGFKRVKDVGLVRRQTGPAEFRWVAQADQSAKSQRALRYMELAA